MEVGDQRHVPAALPPEKIRCPLYRRLGGPQGRTGQQNWRDQQISSRQMDAVLSHFSSSATILSHSGRAELDNNLRYTSSPPICLLGEDRDNFVFRSNKWPFVRFRWPRGLRRRSALARLLELRV